MIGQIVTDKDTGIPLDKLGNKRTPSAYQPSLEVRKLMAKVQRDFQVAWNLQRKPLSEFDGYSLLERARMDQETFAAFVGVEYIPQHKKWRWRGKRNTARNKLIGILAHMLAGMLFPYVTARNEKNEEDKMTARVMKILIEDALKNSNGKRGYEINFLFMVCSALVNPAVFVQVEYVEAMQKAKTRLKDGTREIKYVIDELMSGLFLNVLPIDEILLGDFYSGTGAIQLQNHLFRVRRISYDRAQAIWGNNPNFKYVQAGQVRWVMGDTNATFFDVDWDEADGNFVQVLTPMYRGEDLEFDVVGGVFMGDEANLYSGNEFRHRRLVLIKDEWISVPIYEVAMSGFEPLDPSGRFVYYKSGAFKEYWDYLGENKMDALMMDGTTLDVLKPIFLAGIAKADSTVMVPGATVAMPLGAKVETYSLGPNLAAAINAMKERQQAMSESTQDKINSGITDPNVTATQTIEARKQAQIFLGVFGLMVADLIKQVGELAMDCEVAHLTIGKLDATVPEALGMKYKTILAKGKEKGKNITNRIVFTDKYMGKTFTKDQITQRQWEIFDEAGGKDTDQYVFEVNPYQFARSLYSMSVDADKMISRAMGSDRLEKESAFQHLIHPNVAPFTDPEAVANEFVIEEYADGDPDRLRRKESAMDPLLEAVMGNSAPQQVGGGALPPNKPINQPQYA